MFNKLMKMTLYLEASMIQMIQKKKNSHWKIKIELKIKFQSIKKHEMRRRQHWKSKRLKLL